MEAFSCLICSSVVLNLTSLSHPGSAGTKITAKNRLAEMIISADFNGTENLKFALNKEEKAQQQTKSQTTAAKKQNFFL